jgi:predicted DNA-binding protein with PD1-like motif
MRRTLRLAALAILLAGCQHAPYRTVLNTTTPEQDKRPNNDAVPDAYGIEGRFERVVIVRIKYQADLLVGLQNVVKEKGIRNAVILSGLGSVRSAHLHTVNNRSFPSEDIFIDLPEASADLISVNGFVVDGRVHAHVTLADEQRAFGGHLEPDTTAFTFAVIALGVLNDDIDLGKAQDTTHR